MKLSKELEDFLKDAEKVGELKEDIEFGVNFLINDLKMYESKACAFLRKKLEEKYKIPFDIKWHFRDTNYLIMDYLSELEKEEEREGKEKEINEFRVHIHVNSHFEDERDAEIETLDEYIVYPFLESIKENAKKINGYKVIIDPRKDFESWLYDYQKDIPFPNVDKRYLFEELKPDFILNKDKLLIRKDLIDKVNFQALKKVYKDKIDINKKEGEIIYYLDFKEMQKELKNIINLMQEKNKKNKNIKRR